MFVESQTLKVLVSGCQTNVDPDTQPGLAMTDRRLSNTLRNRSKILDAYAHCDNIVCDAQMFIGESACLPGHVIVQMQFPHPIITTKPVHLVPII